MAKSRVIVIDVESKRNNPLFFFPLARNLTPTYDRSKEVGPPSKFLAAVGTILGERIILDLDKSQATIINRMGLPENKELLNLIKRISKTEIGGFRDAGQVAEPETMSIASEHEMRSWLYWLRRIVDKGCVIREGAELLPRVEELRQQGDIRIGDLSLVSGDEARQKLSVLPKLESKKPAASGSAS